MVSTQKREYRNKTEAMIEHLLSFIIGLFIGGGLTSLIMGVLKILKEDKDKTLKP